MWLEHNAGRSSETVAGDNGYTSNNYKQLYLLIGKVDVFIVHALCNTVHTLTYNSVDDKLPMSYQWF